MYFSNTSICKQFCEVVKVQVSNVLNTVLVSRPARDGIICGSVCCCPLCGDRNERRNEAKM